MVRRVSLVAIVLMLSVAACGGSSSSDATDGTVATTQAEIPTDLAMVAALTCNQLGGATVDSAVPIITKALPRAASIGYGPPELGAAMEADCPETMTSLEDGVEFNSLLGR